MAVKLGFSKQVELKLTHLVHRFRSNHHKKIISLDRYVHKFDLKNCTLALDCDFDKLF